MRLKHHVQCTLIRETRVLDFLLLSRLLDSKRNWLPSLAKISFVERFLPSFSARFCWRAADAAVAGAPRHERRFDLKPIWAPYYRLDPISIFFSCSPRLEALTTFLLQVKEKIIGNDVWSSIFFLLCDNPTSTSLVILTVQHQFLC